MLDDRAGAKFAASVNPRHRTSAAAELEQQIAEVLAVRGSVSVATTHRRRVVAVDAASLGVANPLRAPPFVAVLSLGAVRTDGKHGEPHQMRSMTMDEGFPQ